MPNDTALEEEIRRIISITGPMPVAQYMALCLTHPEHGYYVARQPFGASGDFTTAPEVSQMFGELIGLWAGAVLRLLDPSERPRLIELGPGRGTMMRDVLRALKVVPDIRETLDVHLVEISPGLQERQQQLLADAGVPITWHRTLDDVPRGPAVILANEFVDALPVHQAVRQADGWHHRVVGLTGEGHFAIGLAPDPIPHFERTLPAAVRNAPVDSVFEWRADNFSLELGRRVRDQGAALVIDYGHSKSDVGDTLQAIGDHAFADPKSAPGLIDVTAHVDFEAIGVAAESMGAAVHGPITQGEFLHRLGIEARASALKAKATLAQAMDIDSALARLTRGGRTGMGELFKVMALADPKFGSLPGFEV